MNPREIRAVFKKHMTHVQNLPGANPLSAEEYADAKTHRVLFDPISPTHDEAVARAQVAVKALSLQQVANGFLASLSTRRTDWRSALGSYVAIRRLPLHSLSKEEPNCPVCRLHDCAPGESHNLNWHSFVRHLCGGVDHANPVYAALDLEAFAALPPSEPTATDIQLLKELVSAIGSVPPSTTGANLQKYIPSGLKANKWERDRIVAILGICGILDTPEHPGFFDQYVPSQDRKHPPVSRMDMAYPASWWRGAIGVNSAKLDAIFGHVL